LRESEWAANPVPKTFPAASIDAGDFDALTRRIEARTGNSRRGSRRVAAAANETNALKDLIAAPPKRSS
jgi:hypothetical protein